MLRIGHGFDVHAFAEGRRLVLGGVDIPHARGLDGHSDADVLCHAIADAMLGACGLGDIGKHFPDTDETYRGMSGTTILKKTLALCKNEGFTVSNIDSIVVAQKPKISAFIPEMRERIANALILRPDQINIKATTEEKLGFTGREEGISAHAVCIMLRFL